MTELPHTRTRTVHWIATAAALAAVVGVSAMVQPPDATAGPAASGPSAATARGGTAAAPAPDPGKARFPVECGAGTGAKVDVVDQGSADFDGDGQRETVAVVRCQSGTGTPPSGVFVLAPAKEPGERPQVVATLVRTEEKMNVTDFTVRGRTVSATLLGYSSADVPRCCPDRQRKVKWEWKAGKFVLVPAPVAGSAGV
ncbi:hypothetical protein [Streptomyces daliensis]|uniref:Secreted protein n=1 Tax=Streptomyces daliensis TaxID=299421 RepID=A0A8T4IMK6_9ACTN|nr:hypothetical protein [Streptomyces daliensis]